MSNSLPTRPARLFKYLPPDRLDALDGWLRCSPATVLNDVFELTTNFVAWARDEELRAIVAKDWPTHLAAAFNEEFRKRGLSREAVMAIPGAQELFDAILKQIADPTPIMNSIMDEMLPTLNETATAKFSEMVGVVSFTEYPASLLMWAHYGAKHAGFVIEYDPTHQWFDRRRGPNDEFQWLRPVRYQQQRAALVAVDSSGEDLLLTKSDDWKYEQEWRVLQPIAGCHVRGHDSQNGVPVHAVQVPRDAIKDVIVGARMTDALRERVRAAANGLPLSEAVPRKDVYGLDVRPLR